MPPPRRHRNAVSANFMPRCSFRIAKTDRGLDSEMKAKRVLLRCLGLINSDDAPIFDHLLQKYARLFKQPLAEDMVHAFTDFFGWQVLRTPATGAWSTQAQPCLITHDRLAAL